MASFLAPRRAVLALLALPSLLLAEKVINSDYFSRSEAVLHDSLEGAEETIAVTEQCEKSLSDLFGEKGTGLDNLVFSIHHNGDAEACASAPFDLQTFHSALATMDSCKDMNKYEIESFLTRFFAKMLQNNECSPPNNKEEDGFLSFCDMGHERTPILLDHNELVRVPDTDSLPCRFHTREGVRIASFEHLAELSRNAQKCSNEETCQDRIELHLYAVPAGRVFMFAPHHVGEVFELPHVDTKSGLPVSLEVLSVSPRVFEINNFFSKQESEGLVERALAEKAESHRIKRSTTGTKENSIYNKRTSENGFDTSGETAMEVKQRCLSALGFDEYIEGHTDGLQILRYNTTTAYIPHMDYMSPRGKERHDYASGKRGGNRFATILLYMTDLDQGDGGETVFPEAWPPEQSEEEHVQLEQALEGLRASGAAATLKEGSWEEKMAAECSSRLAVRPRAGRSVLFYSQYPDGYQDPDSRHGGCPVLKEGKAKWAANLWVWNTPREGYDGSPVKEGFANEEEESTDKTAPKQIKVSFQNSGENPMFEEAELFWDSKQSWGKLGHGDPPLVAYTYESHKWTLKVDGEFVRTWVIGPDPEQTFVI